MIQVGTGGWGASWCEKFLPPNIKDGLIEPVAAVDVNPEALKNAQKFLGLPTERCYTDIQRAFDENDADFYFLKERYKHLFTIENESSGKSFEMKKSETKRYEYYTKILEDLKKRSERVKKIVIAGPGFARDDLNNMIKQRTKDLLEKIIFDFTYQSGNLGLQELLKKGLIEKITKYSRISQETKAVETLLEEINKSGKAVYGLEKTRDALNNGIISFLLVSDTKVRDYEEMLDKADKIKCNIMVISSEHDAGEKLLGLGGIAGLLY
jgi:protein pelota